MDEGAISCLRSGFALPSLCFAWEIWRIEMSSACLRPCCDITVTSEKHHKGSKSC